MITLGQFRDATEHLSDDAIIEVGHFGVEITSLSTGPRGVFITLDFDENYKSFIADADHLEGDDGTPFVIQPAEAVTDVEAGTPHVHKDSDCSFDYFHIYGY